VRLHERQFLVGPDLLDLDDSLPLVETGRGFRLGIALHVGRGGGSHALAGRFVTVEDDTITLDAIGSLACYYRQIDGDMWASSSPELLRALEPRLNYPRERLEWGSERNWFPPPLSGIEGIRRLLPSQSLNIHDGSVAKYAHLPEIPSLSYAEALDAIETLLRRTVSAAAERFPLWVPLTAGADSRLILAACVAENLDVTTFTFEAPDGHQHPQDRLLPPRIAETAGVEHRLFCPRRPDPELEHLFDTHTAFHSHDLDRALMVRGQWEHVPKEVLVLGGNGWEVGRCYYWREQPPVPDEYRAWLAEHPSELDWRDRLYIDQRMAGWLGANEQGLDVTGRQRIHPTNCGELLALLLALPVSRRRDGHYRAELVRRLCPPLGRIPINPSLTMAEALGRRIKLERALLRDRELHYVSHRLGQALRRLRS
jgi:hypothetical protein